MNEDTELEGRLRRAAELFDPVPESLLRVARGAYAFRTADAELADLTFDSLAGPAPVRGGAQPRLLTFDGPGVSVDLEITPSGAGGRVVGQVMPAQQATVEVRGAAPRTVTTDGLGRFVIGDVPSGPFSVRCRAGDTAFTTEWVTV
ncbi:carboxypeptidase-like regulatory domain-containing protein [Microbispora sp. H10670]|uniref:carboxypeptidase-like regulatory domain-containing protein n=1 Tax=Microbispora sp. H10670 TaxID=2729108 RepID=UPI001602B353|nr:carboxypeptidase-like regulatory domain-containing protein [Microbispora sp. H10670]